MEGNIRVQEIHQSVASLTSPTGNLPCSPGTCHDWESNGHFLVFRPALNPLDYTSQGLLSHFECNGHTCSLNSIYHPNRLIQ